MYIYICVCVYVCMYVYAHTYIFMHTHAGDGFDDLLISSDAQTKATVVRGNTTEAFKLTGLGSIVNADMWDGLAGIGVSGMLTYSCVCVYACVCVCVCMYNSTEALKLTGLLSIDNSDMCV